MRVNAIATEVLDAALQNFFGKLDIPETAEQA
jgi:hypothetical protein